MISVNIPIDDEIFGNLKQKAEKCRNISRDKTFEFAKNYKDSCKKLSWWEKIFTYDDFLFEVKCYVAGSYYFDMAMLLERIYNLVCYCKEKGIQTIDISDNDLRVLREEIT